MARAARPRTSRSRLAVAIATTALSLTLLEVVGLAAAMGVAVTGLVVVLWLPSTSHAVPHCFVPVQESSGVTVNAAKASEASSTGKDTAAA